jgi:hypothetical protein
MIDSKQSSKDFFNDVDKHIELMQNEDYRDATPNYKNGRKLYLEVIVEDGEMSYYLHKWLYGKDQRPFGCKLEVIHFNNPNNGELKQRLLEIAETL